MLIRNNKKKRLEAKYGTEFFSKYHIGFYDKTTSWCDANLVLVQFEAMI